MCVDWASFSLVLPSTAFEPAEMHRENRLHPINAVFLVQITSSTLSQLPFKNIFTLQLPCNLVPRVPLSMISGHYLMTFQAL